MFKTIAIVIVLAVVALLAYAATRPDTFAVQRSATIRATPEKLFGLINDMKQFNTWNPYSRKDPAIVQTYRGPASGPGAAFDWEGNKEVGKGSLSVTASQAPGRVDMKLDMLKPLEGHNDIAFTLVPQGDATRVTWAMQGPSPYISKVMGVLIDMDKMIGKDFEAGLANLKAVAEKA